MAIKLKTLHTALFNRNRRYVIERGSDGLWRFFGLPVAPGKRAMWSVPGRGSRQEALTDLRRHFNTKEGLTP